MAAKQREMSDSMHYESRQIREALAASNARLKSARSGRVPADLQPQLGASMLQEWEGLSGTGHLDQDNTLASNNTLYQQMRAALIAFEGEVGYAAPARERAFFAALRTQLMEAGALRDAEQRDMQIAATFKWFSRHKPQGPEADPITAAVLASSLSVEANAAPTQPEMRMSSPGTPLHAATQQQQQPRLPSPPSPSPAGTGNGGGSAAAMPGSYTKHYFFDVYSRAPVGGGTNGSDGTPALPSSSGAGPGLRPTSARGPSPGGRSTGRAEEPPSLSINHPLAMYPSVSAASAARGGTAATASSTADKASPAGPAGPSASASTGGTGQPRARFASTEMFAPAKLVRPQEFDELDHRAAQVAAAAAAAGVSGAAAADGGNVSGGGAARGAGSMHPKPWVSGPHKPTLGGSTPLRCATPPSQVRRSLRRCRCCGVSGLKWRARRPNRWRMCRPKSRSGHSSALVWKRRSSGGRKPAASRPSTAASARVATRPLGSSTASDAPSMRRGRSAQAASPRMPMQMPTWQQPRPPPRQGPVP
ncbi:hypothetical protein Vafri_4522 [Volvox africanus]|uniref:Uncharacterized protein n=1 Tax=Volvox africanus TaxID=51714 RepID=A0A8J4EUV0_9CHLO|nr:hypothetical protein Vafri_4522 [Volvox africanus]